MKVSTCFYGGIGDILKVRELSDVGRGRGGVPEGYGLGVMSGGL